MCDPLPLDGQPMTFSKRVEPRTSDNLTPTFRFRLHQVSAQSTIQCSGDSSRSLHQLPSHIVGTLKGVSNWREQGDGVDQELVLRVQFCLKSPDTSRVSDQDLPPPNVTRQISPTSAPHYAPFRPFRGPRPVFSATRDPSRVWFQQGADIRGLDSHHHNLANALCPVHRVVGHNPGLVP